MSRKADMKQGSPTPGLVREIALEGDDAVLIHSTAEGGTVSAWHHHGEHNTYGYLSLGTYGLNMGLVENSRSTFMRENNSMIQLV